NHHVGYRNYETDDNSRNCWWVALLTFGEGWHNNHHHQPRCAAHGHRWFEVDASYLLIRALEVVGLVSEVVRPRHPDASNRRRCEQGTIEREPRPGRVAPSSKPSHSDEADDERRRLAARGRPDDPLRRAARLALNYPPSRARPATSSPPPN